MSACNNGVDLVENCMAKGFIWHLGLIHKSNLILESDLQEPLNQSPSGATVIREPHRRTDMEGIWWQFIERMISRIPLTNMSLLISDSKKDTL